jgi:hypothetical protein
MPKTKSRSGRAKPSQVERMTDEVKHMGGELVDYASRYARRNPTNAALWALGIGFVLGWKLKW